jgi:DNA-binding GntR family transcriptional regulator
LPRLKLRAYRNTGAHAAHYIRKLIFDGHLRAGDRVHQDDVAAALGISRIPVREALVALEQQGWVSIEPNRGAFVTALDEQAIRDHYDLLALAYGFAATKAIERDDGQLGEKLTRLAADFASARSPADARLFMLGFHVALMQCAPRVAVVVRALSAMVPGQFFETVPKGYDVAVPGIAAVARAAAVRDAAKAREAFTTFMRAIADEVVPLFRERGLLV